MSGKKRPLLMSDYKIDIGNQVRDRLAANPAALKLPTNSLDIFVVREFLKKRSESSERLKKPP